MCSKEQRQKRNYLIHLLYVRKEFDECTMLIDDTLEQVVSLALHLFWPTIREFDSLGWRYVSDLFEAVKIPGSPVW